MNKLNVKKYLPLAIDTACIAVTLNLIFLHQFVRGVFTIEVKFSYLILFVMIFVMIKDLTKLYANKE
jgi:hypothetical protein